MVDDATPLFPLRAAVRRTGLKPDLIRAWESRYGAIAPQRSASNQRLYSPADIERLGLLRDAIHSGMSISQIASLENEELAKMATAAPRGDQSAKEVPTSAVEQAMALILALDGESLRSQLDEQMVELGRIGFLERLLVPLMTAVGTGYEDGRLRIAHEHLASATIRSVLETLRPAFPTAAGAPLVLVGTPRGQHHELAALLVAASARIEGWRVTYLGANLPAEELAAAARTTGAQAIAISLTLASDSLLAGELNRLAAAISAPLVVGGRAVERYRPTLEEIGAVTVTSLGDFRTLLTRLGSDSSR